MFGMSCNLHSDRDWVVFTGCKATVDRGSRLLASLDDCELELAVVTELVW